MRATREKARAQTRTRAKFWNARNDLKRMENWFAGWFENFSRIFTLWRARTRPSLSVRPWVRHFYIALELSLPCTKFGENIPLRKKDMGCWNISQNGVSMTSQGSTVIIITQVHNFGPRSIMFTRFHYHIPSQILQTRDTKNVQRKKIKTRHVIRHFDE